ncbi:MAG: tRNA-(ms[2]io[6]A)-hydroxylase [Myxococcaceae bacterium]|nr:tRNA-(ms[2]io[6]A)-hydroxylase [Myxococcaceae bacterium]
MATKRKLPVLPSTATPPPPPPPSDDDDDEKRPPWQWIGFGTAAIFGAWLPLAYVAEALKSRAIAGFLGTVGSPEETAAAIGRLQGGDRTKLGILVIGLPALALALGAFLGGYLVGRWGAASGAGVREAALAGLMTSLIVSVLACASFGISAAPLASIVLAVPLAAWGAHVGLRRYRATLAS